MKKLLMVCMLVLLAAGLMSAQQIRNGGTAWVSSKTAELKASSGFFGAARGILEMGAQVTVLKVDGNWAEVRSASDSSLSGWTAVSNLSSRRIVSSGTGASVSEIALAGKGFNQEIEDSYKAEGNLNFDDVDKTEAIKVPQDELYNFVTEGRLSTGE